MSNNTNNGGPAFPGQWYDFQPFTGNQFVYEQWDGMTLRDYFAAKAMQAAIYDSLGEIQHHAVAEFAYRMADAMLRAREASQEVAE